MYQLVTEQVPTIEQEKGPYRYVVDDPGHGDADHTNEPERSEPDGRPAGVEDQEQGGCSDDQVGLDGEEGERVQPPQVALWK